MSANHPHDGRKYHVGDKITFTTSEQDEIPGIVHGVRYQQGRYELVGAQYEIPDDPTSAVIPGTGHMEVIKGTEGERHSFEYIIVRESQHKAWQEIEKANKAHIKAENHHLVKPHPELIQHVRVLRED